MEIGPPSLCTMCEQDDSVLKAKVEECDPERSGDGRFKRVKHQWSG